MASSSRSKPVGESPSGGRFGCDLGYPALERLLHSHAAGVGAGEGANDARDGGSNAGITRRIARDPDARRDRQLRQVEKRREHLANRRLDLPQRRDGELPTKTIAQ